MGELVIALGKPKKDEAEKSDSPSEDSAETAAQDLIDAIKSGDPESVAMAFKAMMDCC